MPGRRSPGDQSTANLGEPANPSGALLRGLDVLEAFGPDRDLLGNAEISAATGLPKTTVSRLTRALVDAGYLEYDSARGKYRLRPRVLTLGFSLLSNMKILPVAHEQLQRLATDSGCTVSLACPDPPQHMIYVDRCSGVAMPYFFSVGSAVDMARTATGRAYIAALGSEDRHELLVRLAPHYPEDWKVLEAEIDQARLDVIERGFCTVDTTWRQNIRSVAAPLVSRDGTARMSVNCVAQTIAMDRKTLTSKWGPVLAKLAQTLSTYL
ncbi:IclR family transcriptional regulator [Bradyrhizobium sp. UFLA05-109]